MARKHIMGRRKKNCYFYILTFDSCFVRKNYIETIEVVRDQSKVPQVIRNVKKVGKHWP